MTVSLGLRHTSFMLVLVLRSVRAAVQKQEMVKRRKIKSYREYSQQKLTVVHVCELGLVDFDVVGTIGCNGFLLGKATNSSGRVPLK